MNRSDELMLTSVLLNLNAAREQLALATAEVSDAVRQLHAAGVSERELQRRTGLSRTTIRRYVG